MHYEELPFGVVAKAIRELQLPESIPVKLFLGLVRCLDGKQRTEPVRCDRWMKTVTTSWPEANPYLGAVWTEAERIAP